MTKTAFITQIAAQLYRDDPVAANDINAKAAINKALVLIDLAEQVVTNPPSWVNLKSIEDHPLYAVTQNVMHKHSVGDTCVECGAGNVNHLGECHV